MHERSHEGTGGKQARTAQEHQFIHLVRLAWDLRTRGLSTTVHMPREGQPVVLVPRANGPVRIMAVVQGGQWLFTWGRGRDQWVHSLANDAVDRIWEIVQ
jgi:hypothetical protein